MDWFNLYCLSLHLCMRRIPSVGQLSSWGCLKSTFSLPASFPSPSTMKKGNDLWSKQICKWARTTSTCHTTNLLMRNKKSRTCSAQPACSTHRHILPCLQGSKPSIYHVILHEEDEVNSILRQRLHRNSLAQVPGHNHRWIQVFKKRDYLKWFR